MIVRRPRKVGCDMRCVRAYAILKSHGLVTTPPAKSKQRKWIRYKRLYSNDMWHATKDTRMMGLHLTTYLDDAFRHVTGTALLREATSENVVAVLWQAIDRFVVPATILSDNGLCFVGAGGRKNHPVPKLRPCLRTSCWRLT